MGGVVKRRTNDEINTIWRKVQVELVRGVRETLWGWEREWCNDPHRRVRALGLDPRRLP